MNIACVRDPRSLGVDRYCRRLSDALGDLDCEYELAERPRPASGVHFHLANSSRRPVWQWPFAQTPFVVTIHDVVPRTAGLVPLYRRFVYPFVVRRARRVVVHSRFAADLLMRESGLDPAALEIIPHGAQRPANGDRVAARRALGWPEDELIAVLPGVLKQAKLVDEAVAGTGSASQWRLALVGEVRDRAAALAATRSGALLLESPDESQYEQAIVAADCVLCLRKESVGETNGPLLDALGAGRAVLATATGSIPEVAGEAAHYCGGDAGSIGKALTALADPEVRQELERSAARRTDQLSWRHSAAAHAALFAEVFGG